MDNGDGQEFVSKIVNNFLNIDLLFKNEENSLYQVPSAKEQKAIAEIQISAVEILKNICKTVDEVEAGHVGLKKVQEYEEWASSQQNRQDGLKVLGVATIVPKLLELVDLRITCIDEETRNLFKEISELMSALTADENSSFALYVAQNGSGILYKLLMRNQLGRGDWEFSCSSQIHLVQALGFLTGALNNLREEDDDNDDKTDLSGVGGKECYNGLFTPLDGNYMVMLENLVVFLD